MTDQSNLLDSLEQFRREFQQDALSDSSDQTDVENGEEFDEPFIDDRPEEEANTSELFERFELEKPDISIFGQSAIDRIDSIIPNRNTAAETFESFFSSLGVKNFQAFELLRMGGNNVSGPCKGTNKLPAKVLWPNIVLTIRALDIVRDKLGYAINTTSVYRHKDYNECLRKQSPNVAKFSQHLVFRAIDFQGASGSPMEWHAAVTDLRASHPEFGIWTRKYSSFVHIDTRFAS